MVRHKVSSVVWSSFKVMVRHKVDSVVKVRFKIRLEEETFLKEAELLTSDDR
jgi:hypothetical protein